MKSKIIESQKYQRLPNDVFQANAIQNKLSEKIFQDIVSQHYEEHSLKYEKIALLNAFYSAFAKTFKHSNPAPKDPLKGISMRKLQGKQLVSISEEILQQLSTRTSLQINKTFAKTKMSI